MLWMLCLLPLVEAPIEAWFELKRNISVTHFWTGVARGALMILIGITLVVVGDRLYWWQGTLLSFGIFFAFFNYLYNLLTKRPALYLRSKGTDKILAYLPFYVRWIVELIVLGACIQIYIKPEILL